MRVQWQTERTSNLFVHVRASAPVANKAPFPAEALKLWDPANALVLVRASLSDAEFLRSRRGVRSARI
jgi:hypothetical protein